ncbi:MAG: hypothetical protein COA94_02455 [Rickettsiales bacterium]|nr:MAG: hypothetical protein COA94_02455 [Rickettsiales bacterium]
MSRKRVESNYVKLRHPTAFSGKSKLSQYYKNTAKESEIDNALSSNYSYSLHRQYKRPRQYNPFFIYKKRQQLQIDLLETSKLSASNDGVRYLLTAIDCFSRKAWIEPIINKEKNTVLAALRRILEESGPFETAYVDHGSEFISNVMKRFFIAENIKVTYTRSEIKAAIVERFNRTIQTLIYQYLTEYETLRYVDVLQDLLYSYNDRAHRSIANLSPNQAELEENKNKVVNALNKHYTKATRLRNAKKKRQFKVGDMVRLKLIGAKFVRGYHLQFTLELFKIEKIEHRMPIKTYVVRSMDTNEVIEGSYYPEELQLVTNGGIFKVEKVMKKRTRRGVREELVRWEGFGPDHDSWNKVSDVARRF